MMKRIATYVLFFCLLFVRDAQAITAEGYVGERTMADSSTGPQRMGRQGQTITSDLTGKFYEATSRGTVYSVSTAAVGVAAFNTACPPGAAGTVPLALYNPPGSSKNLEVLKAKINWISGTPAAGGVIYAGACSNTITATMNNQGTAGLGPINRLSFNASGSVGKAFSNTAMTGATALTYFGVSSATPFAAALAGTTGSGVNSFEETEGAIVIQPGCVVALCAAGAGTTPVVNIEIVYREAPGASP